MIRKKNYRIYFISIIIFPAFLNAQSNNEVQWSVFDNGFNSSTNNSSKVLSQMSSSFTGISNNENSKVIGGFLGGLIISSSVNSINDKQNKPLSFELNQNFPNPFNPSTKIRYSVASTSFVKLKVYDILGREIAELVNEEKPAGIYEANFEGSRLASGVYIYRLQAGNFIETKKMILLK